MPECVFCKIAVRTADALIIHEDDHTISFLPLEPAVAGHTVLVPKAHHADVYSIPEDLLGAVMSSCKTLALHWREHIGTTGINVLHASGAAAEQSVGHFHLHLFPRFVDDGLSTWPALPRPARRAKPCTLRFGSLGDKPCRNASAGAGGRCVTMTAW